MSQTNYITTQDGTQIWFDNLKPEMLKARDMAWHLAWKCRYNSMMHRWYSNAEHCVLGLKYCTSRETQRQFLVHDVGEMITGDVPSPFKRRCPDYAKASDEIQEQCNFLLFGERKADPEVKYADLRVTAAEQKFIREQPEQDWVAEPPPDFTWHEWTRAEAYHEWLKLFRHYYPEWRH